MYGYKTKIFLFLIFFLLFSSFTQKEIQQNEQPAWIDGVNFSGMFVLEDWFFSSNTKDHYVSTPCEFKNPGLAESRIFTDDSKTADFFWTSETDLIKKFLNKKYTKEQIAGFFKTHRNQYLFKEPKGPKNLEETFQKLHSLGIKLVRVPVTWAITYPNFSYTINSGDNKTKITVPASKKIKIIQDPFYKDGYWASIPITDIEKILKIASNYDIKVMIDVHAYPGGSSDGTFNGVWPKPPKFWTAGKTIYEENFKVINQNLISWAEELYTRADPSYGHALAGIQPMNEPGHLFGIPEARCDQSTKWGIDSYQDIFDTLSIAVELFRKSSLSTKNVKLYMNIIETMLPSELTNQEMTDIIGSWWKSITKEEERKTWAVLDLHHYVAWDPDCNSCLEKYVENNMITKAGFANIKQCSEWFLNIRSDLGLKSDELLASSEFSASTNSDTMLSCASGIVQEPYTVPLNYEDYRNFFLNQEAQNAQSQNIESYFWGWMMPYNKNYKNEWSLFSICNQENSPVYCKTAQ